MASSHHGSVERGAGSAQGGTPGSPPRPMQGRVGDGPAGAGACFVGGFLSVAAPTSRHSFRYSGPQPPPSGQTQPESGSGEEDEEEEGEGEEDEDHEGSGDDSEAEWDPETHGGGKGGDDEEDHEMDGLEPEEVDEGVGEGGEGAATEAASQHVAEGGGSVGVKVGIKRASIRMPKRRKRASKLRERAYPCTFAGKPLGEGVVAPEFLDEEPGRQEQILEASLVWERVPEGSLTRPYTSEGFPFPPTSPQTIPSTRQGLSKTDKKKVESLRLTDADWETLQAVKTFLSPFAKVSKAAEGAAYPTVSMVVPYYNGLIDAMESRLAKGPSPTLQPMIVAALSHLKKYAYITSNEYWIATFLDPSMKAAWFDDAHWEKLHPETERRVRPRPASGEVIKLVRDRVAEYQARAAELAPRPTPLAPVAEEEDGDEEDDDDDAQFLPSRRRLAARLSASQEAGAGGMVQDDEVSRYLSERVRCDVTALEYWRSATNMQTLRRMARDYLAIPATSASSERVFSLGRNLISWKRHRLASQRTRAVMILRSWYSSHPGQRIGEGRRPRGVAPPEFDIEGEGAEEDDEEEEEEGVEADDTAGGEDAVVGSSSAIAP
ncbi:unnamed protein product [Closterium sp. NIES-53]